MKNNEYTMTFHDVLGEIFKTKGWYQGEDFANGVFIKVDNNGFVHVYEFLPHIFGETECGLMTITMGTIQQKYKRVYTQLEIMRVC